MKSGIMPPNWTPDSWERKARTWSQKRFVEGNPADNPFSSASVETRYCSLSNRHILIFRIENVLPVEQNLSFRVLSREASDRLAPACKKEIAKNQKDGAVDFRSDALLHEACQTDATKLCADVKNGGGRVQACLVSHDQHTSARHLLCGCMWHRDSARTND